VSGARGIYRRLRVVEHGCCGRRANLVSVEFVKRSAGERTAMNSRHKPTRPRREQASQVKTSQSRGKGNLGFQGSYLRFSCGAGLAKTKVRVQVPMTQHKLPRATERTSATGARYIKSETRVF
jgi:hypothetical protein